MIVLQNNLDKFNRWFSDYSENHHHLKGWRDYDNYLDEVELPLDIQCNLIIKWLDSLGVYIIPNRTISGWLCIIEDEERLHLHNYLNFPLCGDREEAIIKAIEIVDLLILNPNK